MTLPEQLQPLPLRDGTRLQVRSWRTTGTPRGTLLWIHGGCEHGGRYGHLMPLFQQAGWSIVCPDHRGHGLSDGVRTDVRQFEQYLEDLQEVQRAYFPAGQADVFLGHSFGGLLAICLAQRIAQPRALVLSAPLLGLSLPVPWWKRAMGQMLVRVAPKTRFKTHINPRNMTRDPAFLERRLADTLLIRSVTVRWFFEMQRGLRSAHQLASRLTCPILALQGLADQTVDPQALEPFLNQTGSSDREVRIFPNHVHEVLQETDWRSTTEQILGWLADRFPSNPALPAHQLLESAP